MTTYATKTEDGIEIIDGTCCMPDYCRELGCDFPACATFSGEIFATEEEARGAYQDLEMV